MTERHYFIEDTYYGVCKDAYEQIFCVNRRAVNPRGLAFFCPLCGRLWAVCPVDGQPFGIEKAFCHRHEQGVSVGSWHSGQVSSSDFPGSIWSSWDEHWNEQLPIEVLKKELILHMNVIEKRDSSLLG